VNADWLGAPRLHTLRTIGMRGIGAPSHFLFLMHIRKQLFKSAAIKKHQLINKIVTTLIVKQI